MIARGTLVTGDKISTKQSMQLEIKSLLHAHTLRVMNTVSAL